MVDREEDHIPSFFYKLVRKIMERTRLPSSRLSDDEERGFFCRMSKCLGRRALNLDLRGTDPNTGKLGKEVGGGMSVGA